MIMGGHGGDCSLAHCGGLAIIANSPQVEEEARYKTVGHLRQHQRESVDNKTDTYVDSTPHSALVAIVIQDRGNTAANTGVQLRTIVYRQRAPFEHNFRIFGLTYNYDKISVMQNY